MTFEFRQQCTQAVHIITPNGRRFRAGRAVLLVLVELGWGGGKIRWLMFPPFIWLVELGYAIVAANRPFFARIFFRPKKDRPRD